MDGPARDAGHMELDRIIPDPDQPRKDFAPDAIARLADSLKKHGQLQPIRVRWNATVGKWVVISGERRYRAAALAGLKTVACVFVDGELSPSELLQEQMVENCLREDLKPSEQAAAYRQLMNLHGWTAKELSEELHVSEAAISKALKIERLEPELRDQVDSGEIPRTLAPGLAQLDEQDRLETAGRIVAGELTRDQAEEVIRRKVAGARGRGAKPRTSKKPPPPKPKVFRTRAGRVTVEPKSSGAGFNPRRPAGGCRIHPCWDPGLRTGAGGSLNTPCWPAGAAPPSRPWRRSGSTRRCRGGRSRGRGRRRCRVGVASMRGPGGCASRSRIALGRRVAAGVHATPPGSRARRRRAEHDDQVRRGQDRGV